MSEEEKSGQPEEEAQPQQPPKPGRHVLTPDDVRKGKRKAIETLLRNNPNHFRELGKKGGDAHSARASHQDYVESGRQGGEATKQKHGSEHYSRIGKKGRPGSKKTEQ